MTLNFSGKKLIILGAVLTLYAHISLNAAVLSGQISDQISGEPVPGATVWLEGTDYSAVTDINGDYSIENIPDGYYTVIIDVPNYKQKVYRELGIGIYDQIEESIEPELPKEFRIEQNFPNPFNPATTISYFLPVGVAVSIRIFDGLGRKVFEIPEAWQAQGYHSVRWNAVNANNIKLPSGIYYYTVQAGTRHETRKMLLIQ